MHTVIGVTSTRLHDDGDDGHGLNEMIMCSTISLQKRSAVQNIISQYTKEGNFEDLLLKVLAFFFRGR